MANILVVLSALLTIVSGSNNDYNTDQGRSDIANAFQFLLSHEWQRRAADLNLDDNIRVLNWLNNLRMQEASNAELRSIPEPQPAANKTKNSPWDKYADIKSCEGRPHTFWVYRSKDPAAACDVVIRAGLSNETSRRILDLHNELRQKVARGEETRGSPGPQPPAQNMQILEWDDELADLAQRWANQCNFELDQCRNVERFQVTQMLVNQDFAIETVNRNGEIETTVEDLVKFWYSYVDTIDGTDIPNYIFKGKQDHYAHLVSADTNKLGCGAIMHLVPFGKRLTLVCNYGPSWNKSQPVYKILK